jgi:hypothetical protein
VITLKNWTVSWLIVPTLQAKSGEDPNEYTWAVFCMQAQLAVLCLITALIFIAPEVHANLGASGQRQTSLHETIFVVLGTTPNPVWLSVEAVCIEDGQFVFVEACWVRSFCVVESRTSGPNAIHVCALAMVVCGVAIWSWVTHVWISQLPTPIRAKRRW